MHYIQHIPLNHVYSISVGIALLSIAPALTPVCVFLAIITYTKLKRHDDDDELMALHSYATKELPGNRVLIS